MRTLFRRHGPTPTATATGTIRQDNGDTCPSSSGNSTADRRGCPDTDGDGYSDPDGSWGIDDGADAYPNDPQRWGDNDGDGYDDGLDDDCPTFYGTSMHDRKGCPDQDGDGYSDPRQRWSTLTAWRLHDRFNPMERHRRRRLRRQPHRLSPDACPATHGNRGRTAYGCPDSDQDGWADSEDTQGDNTQWADSDGDGYGDNPAASCPTCNTQWGNSTQGNRLGCPDNDDGWDNVVDALPELPTQWMDQDGDGYGDNATGLQPDACPVRRVRPPSVSSVVLTMMATVMPT